ncbi:MAG: hypothetical protein Q7T59_03925 [Candidatus Woesebacteria bacterium]|nr:hypothetical protein [Candidatus Woesebacteria bacterium]
MTEKYLLGVNTEILTKPVKPGLYTVADQARGFGVPETELTTDKENVVPPAGLPEKFWESLGIGKKN